MKTTTLIFCTLFTLTAQAQPVPDSPPKDHELKLGLAAVTSGSIYRGGSSQSRIFPAIDYQYKRFYFQAGDLGFNLVDEEKWEVDFGFGVNLVGDVDRGDSRLLRNLPDLSFPVNAFVSAQYKSKIGLFKVKHNHEINNKHNGHSTSFSYSAPIFHGRWLIMPQLSYELHSEEVVNYFFGVSPTDATADYGAYQADAGHAYQLSVLALYEITERWSFVGNLQNEFYSDEISDSTLVDDDQRLSVFAGFLYTFF
ncbi:MipA/OmpV family protein [Marinicella meishanensis]|uniref:MipA/OmpV family protein n=1 Tax=Marinicella meishanensis TaxID=2873263 RepID=UPI001CBB3E7D|nr:MipA/OmpV family protein [Marinicella sp. NBU2979]